MTEIKTETKNANAEKRVLVTGAGRGIGRAIALAAAEAGYKLTLHFNKSKTGAEEAAQIVRSNGGEADILQFDVTDRDQCRKTLEAYIGEKGIFWGIVCNSGICADNTFAALDGGQWDNVIRTNLDGFYNTLSPLVMPLARKKRGRIIAIASVSGIIGNRGQVNYSASKAGIIGAAKALAVELASRSITVNCIAPGIIETDMITGAPLDMVLPAIPMGRVGKPEEVAACAVFLLSEAASYITRQVISVNGGIV
ncbi:3-ketoacyl-ACP reductase [Spirochaetia bacterium]|nr:3-ketoacyl-ACP reductase [Spirochaetia bacterium]